MKQASSRRPALAKALLGLTLASCVAAPLVGVSASAQAVQSVIPHAFVTSVDNQRPVGQVQGLSLFQVDKKDFPIAVLAEDGHLTVRDENGTLLCDIDGKNFGVAYSCDLHGVTAGRHVLTPTLVERDGDVVEGAKAVVDSYVEDGGEGPGDENEGGGETPDPIVADPNPGNTDEGFTVTPNPIVANPNPGNTDEGFTVTPNPIVANPNPGITDPFTPPANEPGTVTVETVGPGERTEQTVYLFRGKPGVTLSLKSDYGHEYYIGKIGEDGTLRKALDLISNPGQVVHYQARTELNGRVEWSDLSLTGDPKQPAANTPLELVSTKSEGERVIATFRSAPGADYEIYVDNGHGWMGLRGEEFIGTVPENGLVEINAWVRPDYLANGQGITRGTNGGKITDFVLRNPKPTEPVVAEPAPGNTDEDFTVTPQPVVAEPNPGNTDEDFTVTPQPVVAEPNPGNTDEDFTVTPGNGNGPGEGDGSGEVEQPFAPSLTHSVVSTSPLFNGFAKVEFTDAAQTEQNGKYQLDVFVDGKYNTTSWIANDGHGSASFRNVGAAGTHEVTVRFQGTTVYTFTVTI